MAESTVAEYTLRIAGKNQVTLPEELVTALDLGKGDEFRIVVRNLSDIRLIPYTRVRKDFLTPEIQAILQKRRKEIEDGEEMVSLEEVLKKAAVKNRATAAASAASGPETEPQNKRRKAS
jgi:antitoxin component of MazEF toxin-antitoxin module